MHEHDDALSCTHTAAMGVDSHMTHCAFSSPKCIAIPCRRSRADLAVTWRQLQLANLHHGSMAMMHWR